MITKDYIENLKNNDFHTIYQLIKLNNDPKQLLFILENLGALPTQFDFNIFIPLLSHSEHKIRFWAVKNLGKLANNEVLNLLINMGKTDSDSTVRKEAVSAIGRMRKNTNISVLLEFTNDHNPEIILQAIRGLLVFKNNIFVKESLMKLKNHPNELITSIIVQEFYPQKNTKNVSAVDSPSLLHNLVIHGDVRDIIKYIPEQSIHLTFTSPPYYNARDYSIYQSYNSYLDFLENVFLEVNRITKEGRFLVVNTSPIIIPRISRAHSSKRYPIPFDLHNRLVNNGWEFIDDIVWMKPETSVKNRNASFAQHRKPLAYKPNPVTEYLMVYRKQTDKLLDWNMREYDQEIIEKSKVLGNYETSNIWQIDPTFDRVHSAVFPIELCQKVMTYYSYLNDLIFDPFGGSGTLGRAAKNLGRYFIMTEKEDKYIERMKQDLDVKDLFTQKNTRFLTLEQFKQLNLN